jgi:hypothetical protein
MSLNRRLERRPLASRIRAGLPVAVVAAATIVAIYASFNVLGSVPYVTATPRPTVPPDQGDDELTPGSIEPTPTPVPTPKVTVALPSTAPDVLAMKASAKDLAGAWAVDLMYPRFRPGTTPLADVMNADIKDEIDDRLDRFENGPAAVKETGVVNHLSGGFEAELVTPRLASFSLFWTDDTNHHDPDNPPLEQIETITFDLGTGARLGLADLFSDQSTALEILSTRSRDLLRDELGTFYDPDVVAQGTQIDFDDGSGTGTTIRDGHNFDYWVLTAGGLEITFQEGQVGPVEAGKPSVVIPWSDLRAVLDTSCPVAALAG